jgi:protein-disulfide isomerase
MKRYLPFIIVAAVALLAVGGGAMLYRAKRPALQNMSAKGAGSGRNEPQHVRGNAKAPVTLEEFGDFQCPPCGRMAPEVKKLEEDFHSQLRVVFHHLPLAVHRHAENAACAAEAAGMQDSFWEMHDLLYKEQAVWSKSEDSRALFQAYAGMLKLDLGRFKRDMDSKEVKERIAADRRQAASLGVTNTPTFFLNNRALDPATVNDAKLRELIDAEAKGKKNPSG